MKCSVFYGKEDLRFKDDYPMPETGDQDVLIKVFACGVCGTDIHIYHGEKGASDVNPPVILGHEFSGEVVKVGKDVTTVKVGDRVTVDPNNYCGICMHCKMGKKNMCENMQGCGVGFNGGFAEYCVVPEKLCFQLKDNVSYEEGAMTEPVACCLHGIDLANIKPGGTVCIIGGGAIGLIMAQLARASGAAIVIMSEPVEMRRKIALANGCDYAVDPIHEDLVGRIREITGTEGVDTVIECVGRVMATAQAVSIANKGATVLLFSVPKPDAKYDLPLIDVFRKELHVIGSFVNPDTHQRAVNLINNGVLKLKPLITHQFPVDKLSDAIAAQEGADSIKVLVKPQECSK